MIQNAEGTPERMASEKEWYLSKPCFRKTNGTAEFKVEGVDT